MDKIKFANLIAFVQTLKDASHSRLEYDEINELNRLTLADESAKSNPDLVDDLVAAMKDSKFVEAIKAYRAITGEGLKESKEAIEKYNKMPSLK